MSINHFPRWLMLCAVSLLIFNLAASSTVFAANSNQPALVPALGNDISKSKSKSKLKLEGKAEVTVTEDSTARAQTATRFYKEGVRALDRHDYGLAASDFMRAGDILQSLNGCEKFLAESKFAEAQARRLAGQTAQAAKLYQSAVDLFEEYDPLNAYLKAALDNLRPLRPELKGRINQAQVRLQALASSTRLIIVDRNVVLKGGISDNGIILTSVEQAKLDNDFVRKTVYKAFCQMTCLETTELGSNSITAETRWLPLIAKGSMISVSASSSNFLNPIISVKLNGRYYNVPVDLPGLSTNRRTVFLLTDGSKIIAIDPTKETVWLLVVHFRGSDADFSWKKLEHCKLK